MAERQQKTRLIVSITATVPERMVQEARRAIAEGADAVELRLDYLDPVPDAEALRKIIEAVPAETIATCRPEREGGHFAGNEDRRLDLLVEAGRLGAEWLDVEQWAADARDWPAPVLISHHDFSGPPPDLSDRAADLASAAVADTWKIAYAADHPAEALEALDRLDRSAKPGICLAMGEAGVISRLLAGRCGAFGTFASLEPGRASAPGQPALAEFLDLYRWSEVSEQTETYGVIGCPVAHSMSPAIHNAAFAEVRRDAVYLPCLVPPGYDSFARFLDALLARPSLKPRGLSVTLPHKEHALRRLGADAVEPLAAAIGAVNTIVIDADGGLAGHNTDYAGALDALTAAMHITREQLAGRGVGVLGAGGAARALVAALNHYRAEVTVYNRTVERAERLASEFGGRAEPLDRAAEGEDEILINCTPIGMHPNVEDAPLESLPDSTKVVFDTIYNPVRTRLLDLAERAGRQTVSGLEMFVNQAAGQFELWTQQPAPLATMRQIVVTRLLGPPEPK